MTKEDMANSGVLYINISAMNEHMADFIEHGKTANFTFEANDQGYILSYFRDKLNVAELLPAFFNWKPYWGNSNKTAILHFHGPKPGLLADCFAFMDNDGCDSAPFLLCSAAETAAVAPRHVGVKPLDDKVHIFHRYPSYRSDMVDTSRQRI
eukprot:scaffold1945_cov181-Ochromonas_danica.AAC.1